LYRLSICEHVLFIVVRIILLTMFAPLKLLAGMLAVAAPITALNCDGGRKCVYMAACKGALTKDCPLAYSFKLDGDVLSMEMAGYQPAGTGRYLAIGFNEKQLMGNARVTECSAIGDEALKVKLSYNPAMYNARIDGEPAFRDQIITEPTATYENGMIFCSWKQKVGYFNNDKVFQHSAGVEYHHMVAYGSTVSTEEKTGLAHHDAAEHIYYESFETTPTLSCDAGRTCVYMKPCKDTFDNKCPLAYSYKLDGDTLSMQLIGYQPKGMLRYLAVGFGEKPGMGEAKVSECSAIGDEKFPTVKLSYNTPGDDSDNSRIAGEPELRDTIISDAISKYQDGMIYCSWKQNVGPNDNPKIFQHVAGKKYHHIVAYGPTATEGEFAMSLDHHDDYDMPVYDTFELDAGDDGGDDSDVLKCAEPGRECVYMKACKGKLSSKCPLAYSFKLDGDIMSMELAGYQSSGTGRYLAVGFGDNGGMQGSHVTECSAIGDEKAPSVKLSYNVAGDYNNVRIDNEAELRKQVITEASGKYEDGMIHCSWKQNVSTMNDNDKVFHCTPGNMYSHIAAYGDTDAGGLKFHDDMQDNGKTDFAGHEEAADPTKTNLKKAHGSLMMIAWLICVPIAAIFARFLRSHWPTKKPFGLAVWFHVHRSFNILACLVMIAGFVCIFIETEWQWRGVGSSSGYWLATHSTVGIIACVLAWMQPFISILRCDPQNPRRPIFNWVHRLIGVTAFSLAVTAVAIAAYNFNSLWTNNLTYLILSFVPLGAVVVLFVIMTILDAKIRVHDANIKKIHSIRFSLVVFAIAVAAAAAIALVVMLCIA
ncbi:hypothetical protein PFISCL1PPCAC_7612, partial [Pristionchus fissidentatus]